jgi:hypothetical protein
MNRQLLFTLLTVLLSIISSADAADVNWNANKATECIRAAGKIGLQSEGAKLEFRNIYLEPAE